MNDVIPGTSAVSFELSPARHGWIDLTASTDEHTASLRCSCVYDPMPDLCELFTDAAHGIAGTCTVDQEGFDVMVRTDLEPGALTGRLRIFTPDIHGGVDELRLDTHVDIFQMCQAWYEMFTAYVRSYDPAHWQPTMGLDDDRPPVREMARINTTGLLIALQVHGLIEGLDRDFEDTAQLAKGRLSAARAGT